MLDKSQESGKIMIDERISSKSIYQVKQANKGDGGLPIGSCGLSSAVPRPLIKER